MTLQLPPEAKTEAKLEAKEEALEAKLEEEELKAEKRWGSYRVVDIGLICYV